MRMRGLIAVLGIVACATEPNSPALQGAWGGAGAGFEVRATDAVLTTACFEVRIDDPIQLDDGGRFAAPGREQTVFGAEYDVTLVGALINGALHLRIVTATENPALVTDFTLQRGQAPDFEGWACAAGAGATHLGPAA